MLQADWVVNNQSSQNQLNPSGAPLNQNEIFIRRARLRAALDRWWVAGLVEFDGNTVNGTQARLIGAEASLKFPPERGNPLPLLMATIGLFKIPFGFEVGQSDRERLFLERSTAEHGLFPGEYDAGVRLQGGWRFARYAFAFMDGEPIGEKTGFPLHDPNSEKDFVGRVGIDTPIAPMVWVAGGFSGLSGTGFHPGTPATKATLQFTDRNGNGVLSGPNEIMVIPGASATPSQNFSRFGYGADLRFGVNEPSLGATVLWSELYWAKNLDRAVLPADPVAFGRDYREFGFYVGVTQDLGPHLQAGVRYDFYNPDADSVNTVMGATKPTALAYQTVAFAAALRAAVGPPHRRVRPQPQPQRPRRRGEPGQPAVERLHHPRRGELLRRAAASLRASASSPAWWRPAAAPSASPESGITALLRVSNAQFVEGALAPDTSATGHGRHQRRRHQQHQRLSRASRTSRSRGRSPAPPRWSASRTTAATGSFRRPLVDQTTVGGYDFTTQLTFSPLLPTGIADADPARRRRRRDGRARRSSTC